MPDPGMLANPAQPVNGIGGTGAGTLSAGDVAASSGRKAAGRESDARSYVHEYQGR